MIETALKGSNKWFNECLDTLMLRFEATQLKNCSRVHMGVPLEVTSAIHHFRKSRFKRLLIDSDAHMHLLSS